jgi:ATP-binding cassette subfamily F protein 3
MIDLKITKLFMLILLLRGNYENFEKTKTEKLRNQQREFEAQQQHRAHVQEFIDRFRYNANRASSVQSKIKMLEKL